jgi:two-component system sensor histidine kinase KdpD
MMSDSPGDEGALSPALQYGASLLFVALAAGLAFIAEELVGAPNLTLIFVLPVIASASLFGWGPSLLATIAGVLAFDYFFTEPRFSLVISSPSDIWAAALLLVIAVIVSAVAAESRRRERAARLAAGQAQALQALAHAVIQSGPEGQTLAAAATALSEIFGAPSAVFQRRGAAMALAASAGGARITPAEEAAARDVLETGVVARAGAYPHQQSSFDLWPAATPNECGCVVGVDFNASGRSRPVAPGGYIEIVGAYLAAALKSG